MSELTARGGEGAADEQAAGASASAPTGNAPTAEVPSAAAPTVAPDSAIPALELCDVSFTYAGSTEPVLSDACWTVPAGAFALLVGKTGSGKSTLLSLAKPEIAPAGTRTGTICVCGAPVESLDATASARTVGYVFQNPDNQIVCESVWHEMAFGLENLGVEQGEMRRLVAETSYFFGMEQWFHEDTDALSGGRKQLLALASTLVMQPRVLLLDEPTAQLDPIAEKNFLHALFRVNRELGCTVVVATHMPRAMVDYATCAFRVRDGRVEALDDLEALRVREPLWPSGVPGQADDACGSSAATASSGLFEAADEPGREHAPHAVSAPSISPHAPAPSPLSQPGEPAVSLTRAWFRYERGGAWIVRNLDLDVASGRIHALVGGNGCGKSTLLSIMAGSLKLQKGRWVVSTRAQALLPQDPRALFAAETVRDELMEWSGATGYSANEVRRMLRTVGLDGFGVRHPYDLSGGQQQLLALAKLLLIRPQLLLLDEPTKGLDLAARREIACLLNEQRAAGTTIVLATHDLDFVEQVADEVSMIFDGEVACTASCEEFFRGNVYYQP